MQNNYIIKRRKTRVIKLGNILIGGENPIPIQSMLSVPTRNIDLVLDELKRLEDSGCEIVRVGVPDIESAKAISIIKKNTKMPVVADIHYDYRLALESIDAGADGLRINPGNIKNISYIKLIVNACKQKNIPIRVGVNSGSIDRTQYNSHDAKSLVDSALHHIKILEDLDFHNIKVSLKSSNVFTTIEANRIFSNISDYPIHLGVTEAGDLEQSIVKSSIALGTLLMEGIGDTIRVSITGDVVKEIEVAKMILRTLEIRKEGIEIISCPTCARKEFDVEKTVQIFKEKTKNIRKYLKVAIMGCVVNGPGEAKDADIGIAVGKTGLVLFKKGDIIKKNIKYKNIEDICNLIVDNIEKE